MQAQMYLFFDGRCEEALEFYRKALDAQIGYLVRFKDNPEMQSSASMAPDSEEKILHATFSIGDTVLMASDSTCTGNPVFKGFSLSVNADDEAHAKRVFAALAEGGQINMPLSSTYFSPAFGMVTDRFGVDWMVIVQPPAA